MSTDDLGNNLDTIMRDAIVLPFKVFEALYPGVYRWKSGNDNSPRVATVISSPWSPPLIMGRKVPHRTPPRREDVIVVENDGESLYGKIVYMNSDDDVVGVFMFKERSMETFPYDCLESHHQGNVRWRIVQ